MTKTYTFPATHRLRSKLDFARVFDARVREHRGPVTLYALPNDLPHPRLGISMSRKVGTAARRNRIKRLLRESFRLMQHDFPQGYDLLISFQQLSNNWHADYQDSNKADGLILLGYGDYVEYRTRLEQLVRQGTHFVRWGAVLPDQPGVSIGCDNLQGGRDITRHLLERGRRSIAFVGDASEHCPEFLERYRGYAQSLTEAGCEVRSSLRAAAISTETSGYNAITELVSRNVRFDALVCASDLIAIGAMRALHERGLRAPEDVAVAGFDDIPMASFANPGLTTVQQDTKTAAALLVETLLALIHGEPVENQKIPAVLVIRESTT